MVLDLTWDEEEGKSKKRKKMASPNMEEDKERRPDEEDRSEQERLATKTRKIIKEVDKVTRLLSQLIRENPNTKREVKEAASKLRSMSSQLMTDQVQELMQELGAKRRETSMPETRNTITKYCSQETKDAVTQTVSKKEGKDTATQTEENNIEEITKTMEEKNSMDDFKRIANMNWPEEVYKRVAVKQNNPLAAPPDHDVIIIVTENTDLNRGLSKQIRDRHPEFIEAAVKDGTEEKIVSIGTTTVTKIGDKMTKYEKTLYIVDGGTEKDGEVDPQNIMEIMEELRHRISQSGRENIAIAWDAVGKVKTLRKILEYVFRQTNINITLCVPTRKMNTEIIGHSNVTVPAQNRQAGTKLTKDRRPKTKKRGDSDGPKTSALIIKTEGKPYADVLRKVKTEVNLAGTGIQITQIRKTNRGDVLIALKDRDMADLLKTTISNKIKDLKAEVKETEVRKIDIQDLDAVTTCDEVEWALKDMVDTDEEKKKIKVYAMRPAFGDTQKATAEMPEKLLEEIIQKGKIKIGWTLCRVRERKKEVRCFRCMMVGHTQATCKGPDRRKNCLRCGSEGHIAKDCKEEPYCPICGIKGHRIDSGRCPIYKKALEASRLGRPNKI